MLWLKSGGEERGGCNSFMASAQTSLPRRFRGKLLIPVHAKRFAVLYFASFT